MDEALKILFVEDDQKDVELALAELRRAEIGCTARRVDSEFGLRQVLGEFEPDIIVSDYSMPRFRGDAALALVRASRGDVPFIFVSGKIGEDVAVDMMKAGADDYVMKDGLARLPAAIRRALREAETRRGRKLAEDALRASEEKFRQVAESIREVFWLTDPAKNQILYVSPAYEQIWGRSVQSLYDSPRTWLDAIHAEDRQRVLEAAVAKQARGDYDEEYRIVRTDGSVRWIHDKAFPVKDKSGAVFRIAGVAEDTTEQRRAADELRESERRFSDMLGKVELVSLMLDRGAWITYCNDYLLRLTGWRREEVLGRNWFDLFIPTEAHEMRGVFEALLADLPPAWHHENEILTRSGGRRLIRWNNSVLRSSSGDVIGTASIGEDITERREAEDKIRRLNRVYAVLSGINALIVRAKRREDLYRGVCRIAVEAAGFRLAWIGVVDRSAMKIIPAASAGEGASLLEEVENRMSLRDDAPAGHGPPVIAVRERRAIVVNDMKTDPRIRYEDAQVSRGIRSFAILPLLVGEEPIAVLGLHAAEAGYFDEAEMTLLEELAGDIAFALDHIEKANRLDYLAFYDASTGLANRRLFLERLDQRIRLAAEKKDRLAVAILDIERFKTINDSLGRHAGDALLKEFAARIVRYSGDPDGVGRIAGDQFAVLIPDVHSADDGARRLEQKLKECLGPPFVAGGSELRVAAKAGIAMYPEDGADAESLSRNAEAALKKAKAGGEKYLFYAPQMSEKVAERLALENKLRLALEREEYVLHYQPKVETRTRRVVGVEALIRWQSPDLGLVPPMRFIPLMEETGIILEAGAWALRRAVMDHRRWIDQGLVAPRIAVNVSAIQLRRQDFVSTVTEALSAGPKTPGIDLEITESLVMENLEANMKKLEAVRMLGVELAVDDFGTGYSSLAYLAKLPVQTLKIDRSFIITMLKDPAIMTLVSMIISLAHSLKLKVVAEGVESGAQAQVLERLTCDQMQGYLFSKPVPREGIDALLKQS